MKHTSHPDSDIDIISVVNEDIYPFREHFLSSEKLFDSYVFDAGSLHAAMRHSYSNGSFTLVNSIISSVSIPYETPVSMKIKRIAEEIKQTGEVKLDKLFYMARHRLGSVINDLKYSDDNDRVALATGAYRVISEGLLLYFGGGVQGIKHGGRYLQRKMQSEYSQLQEALIQAIAGDTLELIKWAQLILTKLGGPLGENFRERLPLLSRIPLE